MARTPLEGQVWDESHFGKAGQRVVAAEDGLDMHIGQRAQVATPVELPVCELVGCRGHVGEQPDPAHPGAGPAGLYLLSELIGELQEREVDPGSLS
jgi:hypothetical protein